jgi:hypothetical protein
MSNLPSNSNSHKFRVPECYKNDPAKLNKRAKAEEQKRFDEDIAFLNEYAEELKKLEKQGHLVTQKQKNDVKKAKKNLWKKHRSGDRRGGNTQS